jgi:hypothetical protein
MYFLKYLLKPQDLSTNGIILNGQKIRKTSVILMDGDTVEIPSSQSLFDLSVECDYLIVRLVMKHSSVSTCGRNQTRNLTFLTQLHLQSLPKR